jgi:hypothetical protein
MTEPTHGYDVEMRLPDIPDFNIENAKAYVNPGEALITCDVKGEPKWGKYAGASDNITGIIKAAIALGVVIENDRCNEKDKNRIEPIWKYEKSDDSHRSEVDIFENYAEGSDVPYYNAFVSYECKYFKETEMMARFTDMNKAILSSGYQLRMFDERREDAENGYKRVKAEEQEETNEQE